LKWIESDSFAERLIAFAAVEGISQVHFVLLVEKRGNARTYLFERVDFS
jgi:hypothetical protein